MSQLRQSLRERQAWAVRQGDPYWLWPEISQPDWAQALECIAAAVTARIAGEDAARLSGDCAAIGLASYTSGLGPLLGKWVQESLLDCTPAIASLLLDQVEQNQIRMKRMGAAAELICSGVGRKEFAPVLLKGFDTAYRFFPAPETRPASDIDILVPAATIDDVSGALVSGGFGARGAGRYETTFYPAEVRAEPVTLTCVHADDPWSVDLHRSLNIFVAAGAAIAALDGAEPLRRATPHPVFGGAVCLRRALLLLHLAVHAGAGWHNLTLLRQLELVLVVRGDSERDRLDWNEFLELGRLTGSAGYCHPALAMAEELVPGTVPAAVLAATAQACPLRVRRALASLKPASAHRVSRHSLREHFMWTRGARGWVRQIAADLVPASGERTLRSIYIARGRQLVSGRLSR